MYTFIDEENLRAIIEKSLICYLFYKTIDEEKFKNIEFSDYCERLENKPLLDVVLEKIHGSNIDIFKDKTEKVVSIIKEEFKEIIENKI